MAAFPTGETHGEVGRREQGLIQVRAVGKPGTRFSPAPETAEGVGGPECAGCPLGAWPLEAVFMRCVIWGVGVWGEVFLLHLLVAALSTHPFVHP